ncbi:TetR/AcrR family transcriptional regulator [Pseudonocardia sp. GCM10023141]|uniref:TetR/AcrR family transcriptional regulator n=1 Tax=Pseudonocardia sp. GCM10023141 TaxID=3252653 RepID=UPI00361A42EE
MPYHHGDLRRTLLDHALAAVADDGPAGVSLRDVARRAGVSHAAPTHHFRDKTGLLTALAAEGWSLLADALATTAAADVDFAELGVTYVQFAVDHPAHFAVMRAPGLVRHDDPDLATAQGRADTLLREGARRHTNPDAAADPATALAGWALVHGLAALLLEGAVAPEPGSDVATLARSITRRLGPA